MSATTGTFHYICSHDLRAENPLHLRLTQMFDAVRRETESRLNVEIIPWGGTGPSKVTLTKLLEGEIAFHPVSGMPLSTIVPLAAMEGLPFAFESEYVDLFRADMVRANEEAAARLESRLEFTRTDTSGFVERLRQSGFYQRWRKEFGEKAWTLLEQKRGRPLP